MKEEQTGRLLRGNQQSHSATGSVGHAEVGHAVSLRTEHIWEGECHSSAQHDQASRGEVPGECAQCHWVYALDVDVET